jgi:hypothetical protein
MRFLLFMVKNHLQLFGSIEQFLSESQGSEASPQADDAR